jgi:hypothetical protein
MYELEMYMPEDGFLHSYQGENLKSYRFSLLYMVHTGSWFIPVSYAMNTACSFSGVKAAGREVNHSTTNNAEVKNTFAFC